MLSFSLLIKKKFKRSLRNRNLFNCVQFHMNSLTSFKIFPGKNPTTATTRTTSSLTPTSVLLSTLLPTKTFYPPCPYAEFTCNNKKCIDASLRCNGHDDCGDSTDEICSGMQFLCFYKNSFLASIATSPCYLCRHYFVARC